MHSAPPAKPYILAKHKRGVVFTLLIRMLLRRLQQYLASQFGKLTVEIERSCATKYFSLFLKGLCTDHIHQSCMRQSSSNDKQFINLQV